MSVLLSRVINRILPPRQPWAVLLDSPSEPAVVAEIKARFPFYLPAWRLVEMPLESGLGAPRGLLWLAAIRRVPVLYAGQHDQARAPACLRQNPCYWLNARKNCLEAWEWHTLVQQHTRRKPDLLTAQRRFFDYVDAKKLRALSRVYVFGTGPSLERARGRSWDDGVRLVCNTIVRDRDLWHHIQPHFVLAADAGYHFSFVRHACAFRADLRARLQESDALFLYPSDFDVIVRREFAGLEARLIPVARGNFSSINLDLQQRFAFPELHNILPRLLSVACSLGDDIHLWGFDGRAPVASGFWANSARQSYPEEMDELRAAYPAFFEALVPDSDPNRYMKSAFGDELERVLSEAEAAGKRFTMLHPTWTETLRKRCPPALRILPSESVVAAASGDA